MRALVRHISESFAGALCAVKPEHPIDVALARSHHAMYRAALEACGATVIELPADEAAPDGCFVEDTAVVAGGLALITRPGAPSRRLETVAVASALEALVELATMAEPATLDGGDCMRVGETIYVGRSARTNAAGAARLAEVFAPRGIRVVEIAMPPGVLHLKCVCSPLGDDHVLLARDTLPASTFAAEILWAAPGEDYAANAVAIGRDIVCAAEYPRTRDILEAAGFRTHAVPTSEVRKADGALTCQSILL
jgi:dimethylargininase